MAHAEWYFRLGSQYQQEGNNAEAINCYEKGLALNPVGNAIIWSNKGAALLALKRGQEAVICFTGPLHSIHAMPAHGITKAVPCSPSANNPKGMPAFKRQNVCAHDNADTNYEPRIAAAKVTANRFLD